MGFGHDHVRKSGNDGAETPTILNGLAVQIPNFVIRRQTPSYLFHGFNIFPALLQELSYGFRV